MAQIAIEMTGDEAKAFRAFQKMKAENDQLKSKLRETAKAAKEIGDEAAKTGKKSKEAGTSQMEAFGARAVADLKNVAAGYIGIQAAIAMATSALNEYQALKDKAAKDVAGSEKGLASLAQLASTPEEFKKLTDRARAVYSAGGAESLDAAGRMVFDIESAGDSENIELYTELKSTQLVDDPAVMAQAIAALRQTLGSEEIGTSRNMVSKAFAASAYSPVSADALLAASARSGGAAKAMGIGDEEILAAVAQTATATKSAEQGGTQVASLIKSLAASGEFEGLNLKESVQKIQAENLDEQGLMDLLGREEAIAAYRTLAENMDQYDEIVGKIREGEANDIVSGKLKLAETDPSLRAARQARRAAADKELSREEFGVERLEQQTFNDDMTRAATERFGAGAGMAMEWGLNTLDWIRPVMATVPGVGMIDAAGQDILRRSAKDLRRAAEGRRTLAPPNKDR